MRILVVVLTFAFSGQSMAFDTFCLIHRPTYNFRSVERPDLPSCQDNFMPFVDEWDFNACKGEVQAYERELRDYITCLSSEADEAMAEYNEIVDDFNNRASIPPY